MSSACMSSFPGFFGRGHDPPSCEEKPLGCTKCFKRTFLAQIKRKKNIVSNGSEMTHQCGGALHRLPAKHFSNNFWQSILPNNGF